MTILSYPLLALVGLVLVATGVIKLREGRRALGETIETFRILPPSIVRIVAAVLPPVELAIGICLLSGVDGPWPLVAAALIMIYTAAVISVVFRKISTDCGCFGSVLKSQANWVIVGRNVILLLALLPSLVLSPAGFVAAWVGWGLVGLGAFVGLARMLAPDQSIPEPATEAASRLEVE